MPSISRRSFVQGCGALPFATKAAAGTGGVAVIDWGLLETCLAIGAIPAAATELIQFRKIAVEPSVPDSVSDLGLRGTPNIELLRILAPEMILISGFYDYQRPILERVAPVLALPIYEAGKPPYGLCEFSMQELGRRLNRQDAAERYIADTAAELDALRRRIEPLTRHPLFVISVGDSRHFRAFGADSMFGDVIARLGFDNAWTDPTSYSAAAPVGLEALAGSPDASIAVVGPVPAEVARDLPANALWNALPAVREKRMAVLDPINHFGGLPSARRFARLLAEGFGAAHAG